MVPLSIFRIGKPTNMMSIIYRSRALPALFGSCQNVVRTLSSFPTRSTACKLSSIFNQRRSVNRRYVTKTGSVGEQCTQYENYLKLVPMEGAAALKLPYVWLRDHCRCSKCYNVETNQRNFDTFTIDLDEAPVNVKIDNQNIKITWRDAHESTFDLNWLKENAPGSSLKKMVKKILWNGANFKKEMPADVPYDEFMQNDESLKLILMNIHKYGIGIVGGCPATEDKTVAVSERIGHLRTTFYGTSWSLINNAAFADSAFSNVGLGAHNDNTYLLEPSGIQVFHCIYHDGTGGENLFVDGFNAAANLKINHPDYYEALVRIPVQGGYIGDGHKLISTINILQENPISKQLDAIRYNPFDRFVLSHTSFEDTNLFYKALKILSAEINSPANVLWMKLTPGRVVFVDNWRVLHGRASFSGKRMMAGCYLPRDELNSRLRTVAGLTVY